MKKLMLLFVAAGLLVAFAMAQLERTPAPEGASVYLISPQEGETVTAPVLVRFGLTGMGVAPAGVEFPNTGHHHLLINLTVDDVDLDEPLPFTDQHVHLGGGQTEIELELLEPGTYTLQALLADWRHIAFDPVIASEVVTITVE